MQRSVRRSELGSPGSTPRSSPDVDLAGTLQRLGEVEYVDLKPVNTNNGGENTEIGDQDGEHDELAFQLFAPTKSTGELGSSNVAQKIKLRSPTPENVEPGFIRPTRNQSYYFTGESTVADRAIREAAAVSGADVKRISSLPWPGVAYPWKVLQLPLSSISRNVRSQQAAAFPKLIAGEVPLRRRRLGKKSRIKSRVKLAASQAKKDAAKASQEAKDAADKEKRIRRNREKKVKKKLRDKAKKAEAGAVDDGDASMASE